jgi:predicted ester cyclase
MKPDTGPYASVPDYIYGITREIWEDRGIGEKLARYYADDCLVRAPTGLTTGMAGVAGDTLQTLHQFPDRQLVGEDVVWSNHGDGSFLSSHRLISVMRHGGAGRFGPASGRLVKSRIIADCWVKDGQVKEEWLVRDQAAFARCLGLEPHELAAQLLAQDRATGRRPFFLPEHDRTGVCRPEIADDPAVAAYVEAYERILGGKSTAAVREHYSPGAAVAVPGGDWCNGHAEIDAFFVSYLASAPDAVLRIENAIVNRDEEQPPRVALRWSLSGTHAGWGRFGAPSGAPLYIMGMSHAHLVNGRIVAEWILVDEVSVWKQALVARGDDG